MMPFYRVFVLVSFLYAAAMFVAAAARMLVASLRRMRHKFNKVEFRHPTKVPLPDACASMKMGK